MNLATTMNRPAGNIKAADPTLWAVVSINLILNQESVVEKGLLLCQAEQNAKLRRRKQYDELFYAIPELAQSTQGYGRIRSPVAISLSGIDFLDGI